MQDQGAQMGPPLGPSDIGPLFEMLKAALSNDGGTRKQAEAAMKSMELRQGFCSCLLEIMATKAADHSARWLASVHLKNTVVRHWRPRRNTGGISPDEKQHLRGQLLQQISQDNNQIAVQVAVIFSKIARHDYPREWPSLFSDLLSRLNGGDLLVQRRVYLVFHHVLKELSSKRLTADQKNFAEITCQLIDHVWTNWCSDTKVIISGLPAALAGGQEDRDKAVLLHFERWLVLLKALRRLVLFGFPNDAKTASPCPGVMQVLGPLLQALQALLPMRPPAPQTFSKPLAMLDRGLLKLVKTLMDIQDAHPWAFHKSDVLVSTLRLMCDTLMTVTRGHNAIPDRFTIRCILLVHSVNICSIYRCSGLSVYAPSVQEASKSLASEVKQSLAAFWGSEGRLQVVATTLIRRFLPLTAAELSEWQSSPESFVSENDSGAWQEQLRGSAETLLLSLLEANRQALAPTLVDMLHAASDACPPGSVPALVANGSEAVNGVPSVVLLKEAVYNAVGVGSYELYDYVNFGQWLGAALAAEASEPCPAAKPLRRRAILLVGCWVNKLGEQRGLAYRIVEAALADEDSVIKLAAVETLRALVDDWDFQESPFLEFTPGCMQHLVMFLSDASEQETELKIFGLILLIIERLGESVKPYLPSILALLPRVWEQSDGNALLRIQVMVALQTIVNILGPESPASYGVVLPILSIATDINQPDELNLLEDGLALWLVTLRNAPEPHPSVLQIFPNLHAVMARSTEHIRVACHIIVSAVLLGGPSFLAQHGRSVLAIVADALGAVNERGTLLLMPVIETIVTLYPEEAPSSLEPALTKLAGMLLGGGESTAVMAAASSVFARLLLNRPGEWPQYFHRYAAHVPVPQGAAPAASAGEQLMLAFVDKWLAELDCIAQPAARKLSGLGLCHLLCIRHPGVLDRLETILAAITGLWHEVRQINSWQLEGGADDGARVVYGYDYYTVISNGGLEELAAAVASEEAHEEAGRRRKLHQADPVNSIRLSVLLKSCLEAAGGIHGEGFERAVAAMDETLKAQLQLAIGGAARPHH